MNDSTTAALHEIEEREPQTFGSIESAVRAIANVQSIEYVATLGGVEDETRKFAGAGMDFKFALLRRDFKDGRDSVTVWLPCRPDVGAASAR